METQAMVINCVAYKAGKRLTDVTIEDISEVVKEPDTFIWLGLWQPEDAFMRKIQEEFGLHDLAIEDALCAHQRPKIETYGDSLFIVVKTAQWMKEEVEYGETHFSLVKLPDQRAPRCFFQLCAYPRQGRGKPQATVPRAWFCAVFGIGFYRRQLSPYRRQVRNDDRRH